MLHVLRITEAQILNKYAYKLWHTNPQVLHVQPALSCVQCQKHSYCPGAKMAACCFSCLSRFNRRKTQDYHEQEANGRVESPSAIFVNMGQGSWPFSYGRSAWVLTAVVVVAGGVSAEGGLDSATLRSPPSALEDALSLAADGDGRGVRGASKSALAAAH